MGFMNQSDFEVSVICIILFGAVVNGVLLRYLHQATSATLKRSATISTATKKVLCQCLSKRWSALRITMYASMASVSGFCLGSFFGAIHHILYFAFCHNCAARKPFWYLQVFFGAVIGYGLMLASHFERLRLTFSGSHMELPSYAPKLVHSALIVFVLLNIVTPVLRFSLPIVSALCVALAFLLYFAIGIAVVRAFFKKTIATAIAEPPQMQLLEVAVRVTVVVTVSLLSTTLTFLLWAVIFSICPLCFFWMAVGNGLVALDQCLNSFCLFCTFKLAEPYYKRVFGRLHSLFLARLVRKPKESVGLVPSDENALVRKATLDDIPENEVVDDKKPLVEATGH